MSTQRMENKIGKNMDSINFNVKTILKTSDKNYSYLNSIINYLGRKGKTNTQ